MKAAIEAFVFRFRVVIVSAFVLGTVFMAYSASQLLVDAGFHKQLPLEHAYMQTFIEYEREFGGANRILVALIKEDGSDIFEPAFFDTLRRVTDEVFFIPGIDRARVTSLFTPNVRFIEVVEDGFAGGNVVPDDFEPTPEMFERVRGNVVKSGQVGRLVTEDFRGAMVSAEVLEIDPTTGERLDYQVVASMLEERIRGQYETDEVSIHIIGFAKVIGDVADGARSVIAFFFVAFAITAVLLWFYTLSMKLTVAALACSVTAVIWQLGMLPILGFGIDPMSILVPFLVFAIGVSHGVQMISAWNASVLFGRSASSESGYADLDGAVDGTDSLSAARETFRRLLVPGGIALLSDTVGFLTILLIDIEIIQELAVTASIGVAVIILTNLILLPLVLSFIRIRNIDAFRAKHVQQIKNRDGLWRALSRMTEPKFAWTAVLVMVALYGFGVWKGQDLQIGDLHAGVPELREGSRYNVDSRVITERFAIGVDILTVIAETETDGCIRHDVMDTIDRFAWRMRNVTGVHSVISLPQVAKVINAGWNEGYLKWRELPRNSQMLQQSVSTIDTSTGLLNADCSAMQVMIFTADHRAETIERVVDEIKAFEAAQTTENLTFRLASGNVGVMAATNEAVQAAQIPMLAWVYAAIIALCLLTFRSVRGTLCIVIPLALVSVLAYALMTFLDIGLKVATLPVVVLGVGVGVDYGIYIYSRLAGFLKEGLPLKDAYQRTLAMTGKAVIFTGITLAIGVSTWIFSALKFQADMGILLTFMFVLNMVGAVLLLPALARIMFRRA
ncbi:MAG: MMPL family transporter [Xanthomonadaceae bacterium]|nr:MMPL family transporter [Xanthomonadaceae bacterium]